jgi:hypothetical protein
MASLVSVVIFVICLPLGLGVDAKANSDDSFVPEGPGDSFSYNLCLNSFLNISFTINCYLLIKPSGNFCLEPHLCRGKGLDWT